MTEIRKTNPTRAVLMGTDPWGGLAGVTDLVFPDDNYIILTIHYYEPFTFTHQGADWVSGSEPWLGTKWENTDLERDEIIKSFAFAQTLAKEKNKPINVGEFGAYSRADLDSRVKWSNFLARWFESQGFSWAYWEWSAGFGIFNPTTNQYLTPLANALLTDPMSPAKPQGKIIVFEGNFTPGDGWYLGVQPSATAVLTKSNGTGTIDITKAGTEGWHVQLTRSPIPLKKDSRYQVTIKASSDVPVSVTNYLGKNSDPWNSYSGYKSISLGSTMTEYTYSFQMTSPNDDLARIAFDLGTKVAKINIASIKVEEVKDIVSAYADNWSDRIRLSPNPVKDQFTISGIDDYKMIRIVDMRGRIIRQILNGASTVNIVDLSAGTYAVELLGPKAWGVKMIVKE